MRPQHAVTMYALTVALKNRAERLMVRRVCVAMLCSCGRVSLCACEVITFHTICIAG
jgi:hypothetical protein